MDFSAVVAVLIVLVTVYLMFKSEAVRSRGGRLRAVLRARLTDPAAPPPPPPLRFSLVRTCGAQVPTAAAGGAAAAGGGGAAAPSAAKARRGKKAAKLAAGFEELERRKEAMVAECRAAYLAKHAAG